MDEEEDYEVCKKSADGKHLPLLDYVRTFEGYSDAEEGVVVGLECRFCGQMGNYLIPFDKVMW